MKVYFFIFLILLTSCSKNDIGKKVEKYTVEDIFKYISLEDVKKVNEVFKSGVKIKSCKNLKRILKINNGDYNILKILKNHNIPIKEGKILDNFNKNSNTKCDISFSKYLIKDPKVFLDLDIKLSIEELKYWFDENLISFITLFNENHNKLLKKYLNKFSKEKITKFLCTGVKTYNILNYLETIVKDIDYNWIKDKKSRSIFYCFVDNYNDFKLNYNIDFNAIKYMIEKGANWNLKQDYDDYTPFNKFLHWKGLTVEILQYAIRTGAKWDSYSFSVLLSNSSLTPEMIKYAIKTGVIWRSDFDKQLIVNKNISKELINYAIKKGFKWKTILSHFIKMRKKLTISDLEIAIETGANWDTDRSHGALGDLLMRKDVTIDMVKYAIKTGAKVEKMTPFITDDKKIRDYLLKIRKE